MIDWINLFSNALWIAGCALALAGLSYASWEASLTGTGLRKQLRRPAAQSVLALAGFLFSSGMAATAAGTLQTVLWAVLALGFLAQSLLLRQKPQA